MVGGADRTRVQPRCTTLLAFALVQAWGCSFAGSDVGTEPDLDGGSTTTDADSTGAPTGAPPPTAGSHGGGDETATTTDAASSTTTETSDAGETANADLRGQLKFLDAPSLDLGTLELGGANALLFEVENVGQAAADIATTTGLDAPLIWAGGEFPGSGGDCGGLLPPGATCSVAIGVDTGQPGLKARDLELSYTDGVEGRTATLGLTFVAAGAGPNLFANPRADADSPGGTISGWTQSSGDFRVDGGCGHGAGSQCFFAGEAGQSALLQDIDLSPYAASIDELGLGLLFIGWSESGGWTDDPHDIRLEFYDENDTSLLVNERTNMDHTNWESTSFAPSIPIGARRMRLRLSCDRNWGSYCSAWFDDFVGQLVYPPPG